MRSYMSMMLIIVVFVVFSAGVSMADLSDGLVAYWPMEEGSGDVTADVTGNGNDGRLLGGVLWETAGAEVGSACLNFDGEDDLVEMDPFDVVGGGITLAAWIKPDDFDINDGRMISKAQEWGENDHWWMLSTIDPGSVLRFRLKTNDGQATTTLIADSGGLVAGEWAHVAATWDGSDMRLYKDGAEVGSTAKGGSEVATDPNLKVAIGSQPSDAFAADPSHVAKYFDGLIDDVAVYSRALSPDELQQLAGGAGPLPTSVSSMNKLIATWAQIRK
jgi:hypothetical protein